jgi:hypothetical protein
MELAAAHDFNVAAANNTSTTYNTTVANFGTGAFDNIFKDIGEAADAYFDAVSTAADAVFNTAAIAAPVSYYYSADATPIFYDGATNNYDLANYGTAPVVAPCDSIADFHHNSTNFGSAVVVGGDDAADDNEAMAAAEEIFMGLPIDVEEMLHYYDL